jgi:15-cis-phytoene synthase
MTAADQTAIQAAYRHCRALNAEHGKTFYLATALLPAGKRPAVHALYGFARFADDLVDHPMPGQAPADRLARLRRELDDALGGRRPRHPVVIAVADTVRRYDLERSHLDDFLDSMAADLAVTRYATFEDLNKYMWGSAAVIGLLLLPILGVSGDIATAQRCAQDLGVAFQLTNFIRDVGEDHRRGRVYLPQDTMSKRGVTDAMLAAPVANAAVRAAIADEVARARMFYRQAEPGIDLLARDSRDCVRTAHTLYRQILDAVEAADYDVLSARARVPARRRLAVGAAAYLRALRSRRGGPPGGAGSR